MMASAAAPKPIPSGTPAGLRGFRRRWRFLFAISVMAETAIALLCLASILALRSFWPVAGALNPPSIFVCLGVIGAVVIVSASLRHAGQVIASARLAAGSVVVVSFATLLILFTIRSIGVEVSRPTMIALAVLLLVGLVSGHRIAWRALAAGRWQPPRLVAVVGDPLRSERVLRSSSPASGWTCAASFSDAVTDPLDCQRLLERFQSTIRTQPIDEVLLIADVTRSHALTSEFYRGVITICEQVGMKLHVLADWLDDYREVSIDYLGGHPLLTFSFTASSPWSALAKRLMDLTVAGFCLVALSPVFACLAIVVLLDSGPPILFRQTRCGLRGRPFTIYKFRSMVADAESRKEELRHRNELHGPVFKMEHDPRLTRTGRWLRKSSLDEIPQLWNVMRGEMSLVGPRPPTPDEVDQYGMEWLQRLAMKPGITGLWQVSGRSSIRRFERWVELDAEYIRNWSLLLDLKILVKTIWVVLRMSGH